MFKKNLEIDGEVYGYHAVHRFELFADGTCQALMGAYQNGLDAAINHTPLKLEVLRCDGVQPGEDIIQQIYAIAAADPRYAGAEGMLPDSQYGAANPKEPKAPKPAQPSKWHSWDKDTWAWVVSPEALVSAKKEAKERITLSRNAAEREPFMAFGKPFDADDKAIQRIQGAVQAAMAATQAGLPFIIEWACADNTTVELSANQLIQLPLLMVQHVDILHQNARSLKTQIAEAESLEGVLSISW